MNTDIIAAIDQTTDDLLQTIRLFTPEQFNKTPFEGSWTGGQVAEHLLKSESGLPHVWGSRGASVERPVDAKVDTIRGIFLDFSTRMKSPDFILPSAGPHIQEDLYNALEANRAEIKRLAGITDLSLAYPDFPFPQMGELTGIEWAEFLVSHSTRHIRQMKNIYEQTA